MSQKSSVPLKSPTKRQLAIIEEKKREKKASIERVLSSAKTQFLESTNQKIKREATPSPEKQHLAFRADKLVSPASLKKAGIGSPPKKKPKLWKSKWQLATLSGGVSETGKKKRASEASRLLDDEGVIHMLNRVPSVYGLLPATENNAISRVQRARTAATKSTSQTVKPRAKPVVAPTKNMSPPPNTLTAATTVTWEKTTQGGEKESSGLLSPRRASRNLNNVYTDIKDSLAASLHQSEDCFVYLSQLPADQLELLLSCDIRYSLPSQGLPNQSLPSTRSTPSKLGAPPTNLNTSQPPPRLLLPTTAPPPPTLPSSRAPSAAAAGQVKRTNSNSSQPQHSPLYYNHTTAAAGLAQPGALLHLLPDRLGGVRGSWAAEKALREKTGAKSQLPPPTNPGSFSEIFLRFYESFAQITIAPSKTKLTGSLSPPVIDEIIRALNFVSSERRYRGVLLTGVGSVFCQGVDLMYLLNDQEEKRKKRAEELAAGVERLVLCLAGFPKLLVAAVNGLACGLGLSLLPLCDIVYANDKATFNSFASRLGHLPEGGASVSFAQMNGTPSNQITELFLVGRHLTAGEMFNLGLVNEIFLPGRLMEETVPRVKRSCLVQNSGMQTNKILLKNHLNTMLSRSLPGETGLLAEMWSEKEFHRNLVHFVNTEKCLVFQKQKQ